MTRRTSILSRGSFHRSIWQRLPRGPRRSALFFLSLLAAPKTDPGARPAEPIIVIGCLRSATGLGESARLSYEALRAARFDVRGIDVSSLLKQPLNHSEYQFRDGRAIYGRGTLLVHVNAPLMPLVHLSLGRRLLRDKWVVGYWAWELPVIPPDWKFGMSLVHEIWVPSRFVAAAVAARVKTTPIRVLPHPVACREQRVTAPRRKDGRPFTALVMFDMGSSMERKNPLAAIAAFRQAFGAERDARIIVKVMNAGAFPQGEQRLRAAAAAASNVVILDRTFEQSELSHLYEESDCLVSLHRSEGFGLAAAEAMLHGVPALATDWSGTTDFVTPENGRPVGYQLVPARDPQHTYDYPHLQWAEADTEAAARALRQLRENAGAYGEKARHDASRLFSADVYAASVRQFFSSPSKGAERPSLV